MSILSMTSYVLVIDFVYVIKRTNMNFEPSYIALVKYLHDYKKNTTHKRRLFNLCTFNHNIIPWKYFLLNQHITKNLHI